MATFGARLWSRSFNLKNFQQLRFAIVLIENVTPNQRQAAARLGAILAGPFFFLVHKLGIVAKPEKCRQKSNRFDRRCVIYANETRLDEVGGEMT
jgi:hypothetical protein